LALITKLFRVKNHVSKFDLIHDWLSLKANQSKNL